MPAAAEQLQLKATYRPTAKLQVFYTGGAARTTRDGKLLACTCSDEVKVVEVATGAVLRSIKPDGEAVTALAVSPDCRTLVVATRSLYVRVYDMTTGTQLRSWRGHKAPVADLAIDASGGYVATASADRSVKVWDLAGGFCTHHFPGGHGGVVLRALFHPKQLQLVTAADDGSVRVWDLVDKTCVYELKAHFSAVTSLALSPDGWLLLTGSRDKVVVVWDLRSGTSVSTVPVYEAVEGLVALPLGAAFPGLPGPGPADTAAVLQGAKKVVYFATAGERGAIKLWRSDTGVCVSEVAPEVAVAGSAACELTDLCLLPAAAAVGGAASSSCPGLLAATADARLLFYVSQEVGGERRLVLSRQLVGNQDQVTDLRFVGPPAEPSTLAVATNSETVRLYGLSNMSCTASLVGHRDIVLCLDGGAPLGGLPALLASGSKDHEVRLWEAASGRCLGVGVGHVGAVNGVALSRKSHRFLVSVGADKLIKLWDTGPATALLSALLSAIANGHQSAAEAGSKKAGSKEDKAAAGDGAPSGPVQLRTLAAVAGHDKDINAVAVAPNDQMVATGSQDRTVRVWSVPDLVQVSVLRGHKRGVWALEFAPLERALISASGDKTIKLWSLADSSCLRTLEGHTASVLRVTFATAGTQVLSGGADGLVKLWNVASGECVNTFDEHEDKVWALTAGGQSEGLVATGGGDALVAVWADSTEADAAAAAAEEDALAEQEQALQNALADADFVTAARLAFSLKHPGRLLSIITRAANASTPATDPTTHPSTTTTSPLGRLLSGLVSALSPEEVRTALEYCREWNTQSRHCHAAQALLGAVVRTYPPDRLLGVPGIGELVAALTAYSGRHFSRLDRLVRSTYLIDFTLESMGVLGVGSGLGEGGDVGGEGQDVVRFEEEDEEGAILARLASAARVGQKRGREEEDEGEDGAMEGEGKGKGDGGIDRMETDSGDEDVEEDSEEEEEEDDEEEEEEKRAGATAGGGRAAKAVAGAGGRSSPSADDLEDDFMVGSEGASEEGESEDEGKEGAIDEGSEEEEAKGSGRGAPSAANGVAKAGSESEDDGEGDGEGSSEGEEEGSEEQAVGGEEAVVGAGEGDSEEPEEEEASDEGEEPSSSGAEDEEEEGAAAGGREDNDHQQEELEEDEEAPSSRGHTPDVAAPTPGTSRGQRHPQPHSTSTKEPAGKSARKAEQLAAAAAAHVHGGKNRGGGGGTKSAGTTPTRKGAAAEQRNGVGGGGPSAGSRKPPATAPPKAKGKAPAAKEKSVGADLREAARALDLRRGDLPQGRKIAGNGAIAAAGAKSAAATPAAGAKGTATAKATPATKGPAKPTAPAAANRTTPAVAAAKGKTPMPSAKGITPGAAAVTKGKTPGPLMRMVEAAPRTAGKPQRDVEQQQERPKKAAGAGVGGGKKKAVSAPSTPVDEGKAGGVGRGAKGGPRAGSMTGPAKKARRA